MSNIQTRRLQEREGYKGILYALSNERVYNPVYYPFNETDKLDSVCLLRRIDNGIKILGVLFFRQVYSKTVADCIPQYINVFIFPESIPTDALDRLYGSDYLFGNNCVYIRVPNRGFLMLLEIIEKYYKLGVDEEHLRGAF